MADEKQREQPFMITLGNVSVLEPYKPDPDTDVISVQARPDLGQRVTTLLLSETVPVRHPDGTLGPEEYLSRATNLAMVRHLWPFQSDQPPAWVEGDDDLLVQMVAEDFGVRVGRPKSWKEG